MKFSVGYQLRLDAETPFAECVRQFRPHVAEVYFAPVGMPSGRSPAGMRAGRPHPAARVRLEQDLRDIAGMGVALNVLFNANCYGGRAIGADLEREVVRALKRLHGAGVHAGSATTTSPAVAFVIKRRFPDMQVRASVNMRIGTIQAMEHVSDLFDGFYVRRDFNRDIGHLRRLRRWADRNGKYLSILANSGCLRDCPGQTFHDNLVAHEAEVALHKSIAGFVPYTCWRRLRDPRARPAVLQATWIRPEDLRHYETLFPVVKLATRMHVRPELVLRAYAERRFRGNLLDLLEPGLSQVFARSIVDNTRFPADWFERTSACDLRCERCAYCARVLRRVCISVDAVLPGRPLTSENV